MGVLKQMKRKLGKPKGGFQTISGSYGPRTMTAEILNSTAPAETRRKFNAYVAHLRAESKIHGKALTGPQAVRTALFNISAEARASGLNLNGISFNLIRQALARATPTIKRDMPEKWWPKPRGKKAKAKKKR